MFGESFEEREGILPGYGGHGDDHARLSGRASQNQSENSKGERKPRGQTEGLLSHHLSPGADSAQILGDFAFSFDRENHFLINEGPCPPHTDRLNDLSKFVC